MLTRTKRLFKADKVPPPTEPQMKLAIAQTLGMPFAYNSPVVVLTFKVDDSGNISGVFKDAAQPRTFSFDLKGKEVSYQPYSSRRQDNLILGLNDFADKWEEFSAGYSFRVDTGIGAGKRTDKPKCGATSYSCGKACISLNKNCKSLATDEVSQEKIEKLKAAAGEFKQEQETKKEPDPVKEPKVKVAKEPKTKKEPKPKATKEAEPAATDEVKVEGSSSNKDWVPFNLHKFSVINQPGYDATTKLSPKKSYDRTQFNAITEDLLSGDKHRGEISVADLRKEFKGRLTKKDFDLMLEKLPTDKRVADNGLKEKVIDPIFEVSLVKKNPNSEGEPDLVVMKMLKDPPDEYILGNSDKPKPEPKPEPKTETEGQKAIKQIEPKTPEVQGQKAIKQPESERSKTGDSPSNSKTKEEWEPIKPDMESTFYNPTNKNRKLKFKDSLDRKIFKQHAVDIIGNDKYKGEITFDQLKKEFRGRVTPKDLQYFASQLPSDKLHNKDIGKEYDIEFAKDDPNSEREWDRIVMKKKNSN